MWCMRATFHDRFDAGRQLAVALRGYAGRPDLVVLALPRGGVPVGYELARALGAPLDVFVVRKLGVPGHEELAMGAIATGGVRVLNDEVVRGLSISSAVIEGVTTRETAELVRREERYRLGRPALPAQRRTVILVDDGLATGSTMRAALTALRLQHPTRLVAAVPVAARSSCAALRPLADDIVCLRLPHDFHAVGLWYDDFSQTTDDEVGDLLRAIGDAAEPSGGQPLPSMDQPTVPVPAGSRVEMVSTGLARDRHVGGQPADSMRGVRSGAPDIRDEAVRLAAGVMTLDGDVAVPPDARAIVLFAHGSGSSRLSPRNRYIAEQLQEAGLATLLFDLLTPEEDEVDRHTAHLRFDVGLLADRLVAATIWLDGRAELRGLPRGYFGASTGAAAALIAAAARPSHIGAVVSRGGRPDLAGDALAHVQAPTLLIVGENDGPVIELNRVAQQLLTVESQLAIVAGATHLFPEAGALEEVARLATAWFVRHLIG